MMDGYRECMATNHDREDILRARVGLDARQILISNMYIHTLFLLLPVVVRMRD
jgi:hypothetical protein